MGKIMISGAVHDADEFERSMAELDAANEADRKAQSPLSPVGASDIWDRWNKRGKYAEKRKPVRK